MKAEQAQRRAHEFPSFAQWLPLATPQLVWDWHFQKHIQYHVGRFRRRQIDRLLLSVPPRHGKSEMVTVRYPAYCLEADPTWRVIVGSYSQDLANKFSRKTRRIVRDRGIRLSRENYRVDDWATEVEGGYRAAGVGTGVTGMGGEDVIIDDPVKSRAEANSRAYRDRVWDWYLDDISTRLEPEGGILVIMTRWHTDDLGGRLIREEGLIEEGGEWCVINLPALAEEDDPLGRQPGEALCPARYDEEKLTRIKRRLKESFTALFQGRPVALEGNIVKRHWIGRYGAPPHESHVIQIVQSWDCSSKGAEIHSWNVCTTWAITRLGLYLLEVYRDHLDYPALKRAAISKAEQWNPHGVLIEDKANGQALIQDLRDETLVPVIPIEPEGDKITRLATESIAYEAGSVYHPERAPWLADFEGELCTAPNSEELDQVDSTSQFLRWARCRNWTLGWDSVADSLTSDLLTNFTDPKEDHMGGFI